MSEPHHTPFRQNLNILHLDQEIIWIESSPVVMPSIINSQKRQKTIPLRALLEDGDVLDVDGTISPKPVAL
eukprot:scaffold2359_cov102-Cylindrotheca_fusiformis.AAC.2